MGCNGVSERGMEFDVEPCFINFVRMVIANYVIVCFQFLDGEVVLALFYVKIKFVTRNNKNRLFEKMKQTKTTKT